MSKVLIQGDWVDGFSSGKKAALLDWQHRKDKREFAALVNRLRVLKWQRENPEKKARLQQRYNAKETTKVRIRACRKKRRRARLAERVLTCVECGATWCKAPWTKGPTPRFCEPRCYQRWSYRNNEQHRERAKAHARRVHAAKRAA